MGDHREQLYRLDWFELEALLNRYEADRRIAHLQDDATAYDWACYQLVQIEAEMARRGIQERFPL